MSPRTGERVTPPMSAFMFPGSPSSILRLAACQIWRLVRDSPGGWRGAAEFVECRWSYIGGRPVRVPRTLSPTSVASRAEPRWSRVSGRRAWRQLPVTRNPRPSGRGSVSPRTGERVTPQASTSDRHSANCTLGGESRLRRVPVTRRMAGANWIGCANFTQVPRGNKATLSPVS